jgi:hypothetical protein
MLVHLSRLRATPGISCNNLTQANIRPALYEIIIIHAEDPHGSFVISAASKVA